MLITAPYLLGAWLLAVWIADGAPGWLKLFVLLFIWNALKSLVNCPITLIILIRARLVERELAGYAAGGDLPFSPRRASDPDASDRQRHFKGGPVLRPKTYPFTARSRP